MKEMIALEILNKLKQQRLDFTSKDVKEAILELEAMKEHNKEWFLKIIELTKKIDELEALKSRSCNGCKYGKERYWDWDSGRYDKDVSFECKILDKSNQLTPYSKHEENKFYCSPTFCCNRYEAKEQL